LHLFNAENFFTAGADVAGQSAELAKLVAERLACVTLPAPPEVARETKGEDPAFPPLLNELQSYFTSLDKIKSEMKFKNMAVWRKGKTHQNLPQRSPVGGEIATEPTG